MDAKPHLGSAEILACFKGYGTYVSKYGPGGETIFQEHVALLEAELGQLREVAEIAASYDLAPFERRIVERVLNA